MEESVMTRRRAAARAGFTGDTGLARAALTDAEADVRIAGLRSLDRLDHLDDPVLTAALADPVAAVRVAALELAAPRATPSIVHLLDDPDPTVVEQAAWACGEREADPEPPIGRLSSLAVDHDDALVREAAVAALGALGDDAGLPAVLAATSDKPAVRRRAVLALAAFDGPEVDAAWAKARSDHDHQVRDAVDELLGPVEPDD
ncbi:MAG: HEAT repeat domain-containing protein [Actinomycetota bacterium]